MASKSIARAWQEYGKSMARVYGKSMARVYGKSMARVWQGCPSERLDGSRAPSTAPLGMIEWTVVSTVVLEAGVWGADGKQSVRSALAGVCWEAERAQSIEKARAASMWGR